MRKARFMEGQMVAVITVPRNDVHVHAMDAAIAQ
jgi:hypothetical protein